MEVDPKRRYQQFADFQKLLVADLPDIGVTSSPDLTIYDKRLIDHTVGAEGLNGSLSSAYFVS